MIKNAIDIEGKKVIFDINDFDTQVEIHFFSMFPINFENFTKRTGIKPTFQYNKGDIIRGQLYRQEYCWTYCTDVVKDIDISKTVNNLMEKIQNPEILSTYLKSHNINVKISIVIRNFSYIPGFHFTLHFMEFCTILGAIVEVDFS